MINLELDLSRIKSLIRKELFWYLNNPGGSIVAAIFIGFGNFLYFRDFFINGNASLRPYFLTLPWLLIFLIAAVSMRIFSEEKKSGTFEILISLPLNEWELVLGKFLAHLLFLSFCLLGSVTLPVTLFFLGKPDLGTLISGYFGALLLCAALLSIGLFISALTKNQVTSLLLTILTFFLLIVAGDELILRSLPEIFSAPLSFLGFTGHFSTFPRGVIDLRDLIFFLTTTFGFIFLSVRITENRN